MFANYNWFSWGGVCLTLWEFPCQLLRKSCHGLFFYSSTQFVFKVSKWLILLFLACELDWPFLSWAGSCLNGLLAPASMKSMVGKTGGGAGSDTPTTFIPHLPLQRAGAQLCSYRLAPPACGAAGAIFPLEPCRSSEAPGCPEKPWVCFVHVQPVLLGWVNKVFALPKHQGVRQTTLPKNLASCIQKIGHRPSPSRVWLLICARKTPPSLTPPKVTLGNLPSALCPKELFSRATCSDLKITGH